MPRLRVTKCISSKAQSLLIEGQEYNYDIDYITTMDQITIYTDFRVYTFSDNEFLWTDVTSAQNTSASSNSKYTLPVGLYNVSYDAVYTGLDSVKQESTETKTVCECGTSKIMGTNDDPQFHSTWCPIYKERK